MRADLLALASWAAGVVGVTLVAAGVVGLVVIPERVAAVAWLAVLAGVWALLLAYHLLDESRQETA